MRYVLALLIVFVLSSPVEAQQPTKISRIAFLSALSASSMAARMEAFRQGLRPAHSIEKSSHTLIDRQGNLEMLVNTEMDHETSS